MSTLVWSDLDRRAVDTIRTLAMDAVEKAGNGHPGTAMSLAPAAYLLFQRVMRHDPTDPAWPGRDRFVLSCGHSSLTLYIQLYFSGYGLDLNELRSWSAIVHTLPLALDLYSALWRRMTPARVGSGQRVVANLRQHCQLHRSFFVCGGMSHRIGVAARQTIDGTLD